MRLTAEPLGLAYAFDALMETRIGSRSEAWDADMWRGRGVHGVGKVILAASQKLEERINRLNFTDEERKPGGTYIGLTVAIKNLADIGNALLQEPPEKTITLDFPWAIISALVNSIASLLAYAEQRA